MNNYKAEGWLSFCGGYFEKSLYGKREKSGEKSRFLGKIIVVKPDVILYNKLVVL